MKKMKKKNKFALFSTAALLIATVTAKSDIFAWLLLGSSLILIIEIIGEFLTLRKN